MRSHIGLKTFAQQIALCHNGRVGVCVCMLHYYYKNENHYLHMCEIYLKWRKTTSPAAVLTAHAPKR